MTIFAILDLIIKTLIILVPVLVSVAFFTLFERKVMASIQRRRGPNVVGLLGVLQPFADGLKLLIKETIIPSRANKITDETRSKPKRRVKISFIRIIVRIQARLV